MCDYDKEGLLETARMCGEVPDAGRVTWHVRDSPAPARARPMASVPTRPTHPAPRQICDMANKDNILAFARAVREAHGDALHMLFNNAGIVDAGECRETAQPCTRMHTIHTIP